MLKSALVNWLVASTNAMNRESINASKIAKLEKRLNKLEDGADHIDGPNSYFVLFLFIFFAQLLSGGLLFIVGAGVREMWEFASYVFPTGAAAIAGFGLFRRQWIIPAFKLSVLILWLGLISFIFSKDLDVEFVAAAGGLTGASISLYLIKRLYNKKVGGDRISNEVYLYILLLAACIGVTIWGACLLKLEAIAKDRAVESRERLQETERMIQARKNSPHDSGVQIKNAGVCDHLPLMYLKACLK